MSGPSSLPARLPGGQRRRLTIKNINVGTTAIQSIPSTEQSGLDRSREAVGAVNALCPGSDTAVPVCAVSLTECMSQMGLDQHNGAPASVESVSDIGHNSEDTDPSNLVINRETTFKWAASDVSRHCSFRMLHTFAKCFGLCDNERWLCCSLKLLNRGVSLATPLPQDKSNKTSITAMSLDGKKPLRNFGCKFDTGATVPVIRESCARRLNWIPAMSFDPDRYDLTALSRRLEIVPIGFLKMPVRLEGRRRQCVVDFLVVQDKDSDKYDIMMSEKFIKRLHLHHRITFCPTGVCMALSSILRPASIQTEG